MFGCNGAEYKAYVSTEPWSANTTIVLLDSVSSGVPFTLTLSRIYPLFDSENLESVKGVPSSFGCACSAEIRSVSFAGAVKIDDIIIEESQNILDTMNTKMNLSVEILKKDVISFHKGIELVEPTNSIFIQFETSDGYVLEDTVSIEVR